MGKIATATIICNSGMMTQIIRESLRSVGIEVKDLAGWEADGEGVDLAIVVSGFCGDPASIPCLKEVAGFRTNHWLVLSRDRHDPLTVILNRSGADVCVIPDDIDGIELAHAAALVASGSKVTMGRFCDVFTADEMQRLSDASLDEGQWRLMAMLADGYTNKTIARIDDTSEAAIKARIRILLDRLNVTNRTQAAVMAARAGLRYEMKTPLNAA